VSDEGEGNAGEAHPQAVWPTHWAHPIRPGDHPCQPCPHSRGLFRSFSRSWWWGRREQFTVLRGRDSGRDAGSTGHSGSESHGGAGRVPDAGNCPIRGPRADRSQAANLEAGTSGQNHFPSWASLGTSRTGRNSRGALLAKRALQHRGSLQVRAVESPGAASQADGWGRQRLVELADWDKHHPRPVANHSDLRACERSELHQRHLGWGSESLG